MNNNLLILILSSISLALVIILCLSFILRLSFWFYERRKENPFINVLMVQIFVIAGTYYLTKGYYNSNLINNILVLTFSIILNLSIAFLNYSVIQSPTSQTSPNGDFSNEKEHNISLKDNSNELSQIGHYDEQNDIEKCSSQCPTSLNSNIKQITN